MCCFSASLSPQIFFLLFAPFPQITSVHSSWKLWFLFIFFLNIYTAQISVFNCGHTPTFILYFCCRSFSFWTVFFFGRRFISTASEHVTFCSRGNKQCLKNRKKTHQRYYVCLLEDTKSKTGFILMECSFMIDLLRLKDWTEFKEGIHWLTTVAFC